MYIYIGIKYTPNRLVCFPYSTGEDVREPPNMAGVCAWVRVCVVHAQCLSRGGVRGCVLTHRCVLVMCGALRLVWPLRRKEEKTIA